MSTNVVPAEEQPLANALAKILDQPRPELARALSAAQARCRAVEKSSYNSFHRYSYASADAIIAAGQESLSSNGLALMPLKQTILRGGGDGLGPELDRTFLLLHSSGECFPIRVVWPIVVEKGRPLDKASAIADTLSLSYLLRDLLLMPRVDASEDVNEMDDRPKSASPPPDPAHDLVDRRDRAMKLINLDVDTDVGRQAWSDGLFRLYERRRWEELTDAQQADCVQNLETRAAAKANGQATQTFS